MDQVEPTDAGPVNPYDVALSWVGRVVNVVYDGGSNPGCHRDISVTSAYCTKAGHVLVVDCGGKQFRQDRMRDVKVVAEGEHAAPFYHDSEQDLQCYPACPPAPRAKIDLGPLLQPDFKRQAFAAPEPPALVLPETPVVAAPVAAVLPEALVAAAALPEAPVAAATLQKTRCNYIGPKGGGCPSWALQNELRCPKHACAPQHQATSIRAGDAPQVKTPGFVVLESPPMNMDMARALASTKDFSDVLPWKEGRTCTILDFVELYARRVCKNHKGFQFTNDY